MTSNAAPQPLHLHIPRVLILYPSPPVITTTGYDASDPFEEPIPGQVISGKFRLPHGVTDRFAELTEYGYVGVDGEPIEGELVSWEWPSADQLADWNDAKRDRDPSPIASEFGAAFADENEGRVYYCSADWLDGVNHPWCWSTPWGRPAAKCGGMS